MKGGTVTDLKAAENAIRHTVHAAENMAAPTLRGYPLREVIVSLPAPHARQTIVPIEVNISGHEVTQNDITRALSKAQTKALQKEEDEVLIHSIPVNFKLDGNNGIQEPAGMVADTLQMDANIIAGDSHATKNISTTIERSHLDIIGFCHSAYASGLSSLVDDEMELGATVVEMGGGVTSIAVFAHKKLIYIDSIPVGGQHVTSDIARGLTTSLEDAERLKTLYGSAMATLSDDHEMIDVPQIGEDSLATSQHIPRSLLVGIIQPRLEEIFEMVRAKLQDSGLGPVAGRRIVLTGGASQIPGLRDLSQYILDRQVRLGRPIRTHGLAEQMQGPEFACAAGLLTYLMERSHEMPAEISASADERTILQRFTGWVKENW